MKPPEHPTHWIERFILTVSVSFATTTKKNDCLDIVLNYVGDEWISSTELLLVNTIVRTLVDITTLHTPVHAYVSSAELCMLYDH